MKINSNKSPGLLVPPPVYYFIMLLLGVGLNHFFPTTILPIWWGSIITAVFIISSVIIMPSILAKFRSVGTPFDVRKAATTLITDGPYKYSRNPSYISLTLLYLGIGFALNNAWVLSLVIVVLLIINFHVIRREETNLEKIFGEEYVHYKSSVRRWL